MAREQVVDGQHPRRRSHLGVDLGLRRLARAQAEGDVVVHRHVRVERVVLEHHRDVAPRGGKSLTTSPPIAMLPLSDVLQPGDGAQQRALAATRLADQHGELAGRDLQVDAAHGMHRAVVLVQAGDSQVGHVVCATQPFTAPSEMPRTR